MTTPKSEAQIEQILHKLVLDILDVANVAQVRIQTKKSLAEINKARETAQSKLLQLLKEARIDELRHIDDPVNVNLYHYGLISVKDRIAELSTTSNSKEEK